MWLIEEQARGESQAPQLPCGCLPPACQGSTLREISPCARKYSAARQFLYCSIRRPAFAELPAPAASTILQARQARESPPIPLGALHSCSPDAVRSTHWPPLAERRRVGREKYLPAAPRECPRAARPLMLRESCHRQ